MQGNVASEVLYTSLVSDGQFPLALQKTDPS